MSSQFEKRAKKTKSVDNEISTPEQGNEAVANLNRVGYDFFYDDVGRNFLKVSIKYCLVTGKAEVQDVVPVADSLARVVQESQKVFVNKLMGIKGAK